MNGFSLFELIVVMAIVSVMSALAAPRIMRGGSEHDETFAIVSQIREHQRNAVRSGSRITADLDGVTFQFLPTGVVIYDHTPPDTVTYSPHPKLDNWSGDVARK